jgi:hypothetical protein
MCHRRNIATRIGPLIDGRFKIPNTSLIVVLALPSDGVAYTLSFETYFEDLGENFGGIFRGGQPRRANFEMKIFEKICFQM